MKESLWEDSVMSKQIKKNVDRKGCPMRTIMGPSLSTLGGYFSEFGL